MSLKRAIGLMSGTSMDGVDVALIETDGRKIAIQGPEAFWPYDDANRALLRQALVEAKTLVDRAARPGALALAEDMIVARHAEAVEAFLKREAIDRSSIDVVGFHGQTVIHRPDMRLTVQIGDGAALADQLGIPVAFDFRAADVAAGGQGAPLVPAYHRALVEAAAMASPVVVLNLGGVANVTYVDDGADPIACDTGPANALIDDLMLARAGQPMDRDGATAARGRVDQDALLELLRHPYFDLPPPKSLDRDAFSREPVEGLSLEDAAATLTAFTAESVARAVRLLPKAAARIIVCGGGARNRVLMRELADRLGCPVDTAVAHGWSADAMEAQAFAYLAVRSMDGQPLTFPTTTGVYEPLTGGRLARPRPALRARRAG